MWLLLALAAAGSLAVVGALVINNEPSRPARSRPRAMTAEADAAAQTTTPPDDAGVTDDALEADASVDARPPIEDPPPGQLRIITPPMPADPQAMKDWRKVADKLYERKLDDARAKLIEWENKWGASEETLSLHRQLDAISRPH